MSNIEVVGRVPGALRLRCRVCGEEFNATCEECAASFSAAHEHSHYGLGDLVAIGIKRLFGIAPCKGCVRRKQALNRVAPRMVRR